MVQCIFLHISEIGLNNFILLLYLSSFETNKKSYLNTFDYNYKYLMTDMFGKEVAPCSIIHIHLKR